MTDPNQSTERAPLPPGYALEFYQAEVGVHCPDGRTKWFESSKDAKDWAWEDSAQPKLHWGSRIINLCQADDDDYCEWSGCPQIADGEPQKTGRHCPLDIRSDNESVNRKLDRMRLALHKLAWRDDDAGRVARIALEIDSAAKRVS